MVCNGDLYMPFPSIGANLEGLQSESAMLAAPYSAAQSEECVEVAWKTHVLSLDRNWTCD